jgi:monoamine oxidase
VLAVHAHDWVRDPWSRGRWSVLRPGQVHRPWSAVRAPDFGGGHTALPWPSFMDGAVESGRRVAAEVSRRTPEGTGGQAASVRSSRKATASSAKS